MTSRTAYQRLVQSGARVTRDVRRRDVEDAVLDPRTRAVVLIGHHTRDGVELQDGVIPAHALKSLLEARNAHGAFPFVWLVCSSDNWARAVVLIAPDVLPFSAPIQMELPGAIETCAAWIEGLDGATPFDVAKERAFARQFPSDQSGGAAVIVDARSAAGHVKRDVERTVRALTSDAAVGIMRRTLEDAGVLPSPRARMEECLRKGLGACLLRGPGAGANSLADSVAAEPVESFESIRFRGACQLAIDMLEQDHLRRGRYASFLLGLSSLCVFAAIVLVVIGSFWRGTTTHVSALASLMASGAIGLWYRHVAHHRARASGSPHAGKGGTPAALSTRLRRRLWH